MTGEREETGIEIVSRLLMKLAKTKNCGEQLLLQSPSTIEQFSLEFRKNNPLNQSGKTRSNNMKRARSAGKFASANYDIGFGFTSDWLKKWREYFFNQSLGVARQNQSKRKYFRYSTRSIKAGVHFNVVFPSLNMGLIEISRSRFKQSRNSVIHNFMLTSVL